MSGRRLHFSELAEADMLGIAQYSLQRWGEAQAARYLAQLARCCDRIAEYPRIGRACPGVLPGLRRIEEGSHTVFFLVEEDDVLIVRVLHNRMQPERWIRGEEE